MGGRRGEEEEEEERRRRRRGRQRGLSLAGQSGGQIGERGEEEAVDLSSIRMTRTHPVRARVAPHPDYVTNFTAHK